MKIILVILILLTISFGFVFNFYEYKYISLENIPEIQILSYGKSELSHLQLSNEMPIRYKLIREKYILIFEVDKKNHWPSILVGSMSLNGDELIIEDVKVGYCGGFDDEVIPYKMDNLKALRYVWSPAYRKNCSVKNNQEYLPDQIIKFKVQNRNGDLFGTEELPFSLISNGIYYEIDGL